SCQPSDGERLTAHGGRRGEKRRRCPARRPERVVGEVVARGTDVGRAKPRRKRALWGGMVGHRSPRKMCGETRRGSDFPVRRLSNSSLESGTESNRKKNPRWPSQPKLTTAA